MYLEPPANNTNNKTTVVDEVKSEMNLIEYFIFSLKFIEVKDWTSDQCIQWLTAQEMTSFIPIFLNRNIDGEKLLLLDSTKMKVWRK